MPRQPIAPPPDTIAPHAPAEAPRIDAPGEQPAPGAPEHVCPPDPSYTPDTAPLEQPPCDPDD